MLLIERRRGSTTGPAHRRLVEREGRALVIAVNKWDLVDAGATRSPRAPMPTLAAAGERRAVVAVSGLTGEGVDRLMSAIERLCGVEQARADGCAEPLVRANVWPTRRRRFPAGASTAIVS